MTTPFYTSDDFDSYEAMVGFVSQEILSPTRAAKNANAKLDAELARLRKQVGIYERALEEIVRPTRPGPTGLPVGPITMARNAIVEGRKVGSE